MVVDVGGAVERQTADVAARRLGQFELKLAGEARVVNHFEDVADNAAWNVRTRNEQLSHRDRRHRLGGNPPLRAVEACRNERGSGAGYRSGQRLVIADRQEAMAAAAQDAVDETRVEELCPGRRGSVPAGEVREHAGPSRPPTETRAFCPSVCDGGGTSP